MSSRALSKYAEMALKGFTPLATLHLGLRSLPEISKTNFLAYHLSKFA